MRICVVSTSLFQLGVTGLTNYGGLEQIAWLCAKGLAEKGHEVALVAPDGSSCPGVSVISSGPVGNGDEKLTYGGFTYQIPGTENLPQEQRVRKVEGYWQYLPSFDAIIDHSWNKWSYMLKAEGVLKAPVLGVMHAPVNTMWQSPPPVEKPCIVCISQDQANHFSALHNRPARVCYNGIDLDLYKPLNIPRTDRFLFLARFSTIKGPDIAIEACKEAGVGLDLIGDTSITNEPELYARCNAMADGKQIRIVGAVPRSEAVWWYSQAHAMLHPNKLFREPFGLAPVEAMACGLPVIAWNNGAMRETVRDGASGLLVNSFEDLVRSIKSEWMKNIIPEDREGCEEQASKFSVQRMVHRYAELCEEAIAGGW